eukprot:13325687-Alexandrium_andersonii.AAC.1
MHRVPYRRRCSEFEQRLPGFWARPQLGAAQSLGLLLPDHRLGARRTVSCACRLDGVDGELVQVR